MALAPLSADVLDFPARVAQAYAVLIASSYANPDSCLGGRLFYAGELDAEGRVLTVAANIAGAATLVASADRAAQKQAIRDGIADFLVNSLDEALRILKNQLRKREPVAVCVGLDRAAIELEMHTRGVAPDLVRRDLHLAPRHELLAEEAMGDQAARSGAPALVVWQVAAAAPKDLARLDEIALQCLSPEDWAARRWLHLAPRYLGRLAQGLRLLSTQGGFAARFADHLKACAARGEIAFPYELRSYFLGR